jgi:hypothetical protein
MPIKPLGVAIRMEMRYMATSRMRRRLYGALAALAVAVVGIVAHPSPAAAAGVALGFNGPSAYGLVGFTSQDTQTATLIGVVWGDVDGPGYIVDAVYFGVGEYSCASVTRRNYTSAVQKSYSDTLHCPWANIEGIRIVFIPSNTVQYFDNPYD